MHRLLADLQTAVRLAVLCVGVLLTSQSMAEPVVVVEGVKILNGNREEAVHYYENNWAQFRREAEKSGAIDSFELIVANGDDESPIDILLITRFASEEQYADIERVYESLVGERSLNLLNDLEPASFRRNEFVIVQSRSQSP